MRKTILISLFAASLMVPASVQAQKTASKPVVLPGSKLNVEKLNAPIDMNMDISSLGISDLRILRNAFAARKGYCFTSYDLRGIYSQTSWYMDLAEKRDIAKNPAPIRLTPAEKAFTEKLRQRENELLKNNFRATDGGRVNTDNIINKYQLEEQSPALYQRLSRDGFAIVPNTGIQLFHEYEKNDYHDFPSFVTTDMYLQLFHAYFEYMLKNIESAKLIPMLGKLYTGMYRGMSAVASIAADPATKANAEYEMAYFAIGYRILTGKSSLAVPARYQADAAAEVKNVDAAVDATSDYLGYPSVPFMYSLFKPRGHYTRSAALQRYFKSMMWLQYVSCCLDSEDGLRRAVLQSSVISSAPAVLQQYEAISDPITFLIGQPDNVSVLQVAELMKKDHYSVQDLMQDTKKLSAFRDDVSRLFASQTRIVPKTKVSCADKINIMPQRYNFDSEVLQELVDYKSRETKRGFPRALDVMAAYGCPKAEDILLNERGEARKWPEYTSVLNTMKQKVGALTSVPTVYNRWMDALVSMQTRDARYPYFMQTPQWDKKNLNAALASYAELKHDAILYSKQPMGAECGGGGLPEPIVVGYVEPNVAYWQKALDLVKYTSDMIEKHGLMTDDAKSVTESMEENARFFLDVSNKELAGTALTEQEFNSIEKIGSAFEWLTLSLVKDSANAEGPTVWSDVEGADKSLSVVADVYTANSPNNANKGILHEGTGTVDDIYVVVQINGYLYLTRGAVFSYRECVEPLGSRLTDEQWQEKLKKAPRYGVPEWMMEIILPGKAPVDNESEFYSSGC